MKISKTYRMEEDCIKLLEKLAKAEDRSYTNMLEQLIKREAASKNITLDEEK